MKLKSTYPKETKKMQKKGKQQQEERTNIQPRDDTQRDNTQNCKSSNGPIKERERERERERESNGMEWNELLWRFFIHSFLSFLV